MIDTYRAAQSGVIEMPDGTPEGVTQHCQCGNETYHIIQTYDRTDAWAQCTECGRPTAVFGIGPQKQIGWYEENDA